jgi:hypothetical protein
MRICRALQRAASIVASRPRFASVFLGFAPRPDFLQPVPE